MFSANLIYGARDHFLYIGFKLEWIYCPWFDWCILIWCCSKFRSRDMYMIQGTKDHSAEIGNEVVDESTSPFMSLVSCEPFTVLGLRDRLFSLSSSFAIACSIRSMTCVEFVPSACAGSFVLAASIQTASKRSLRLLSTNSSEHLTRFSSTSTSWASSWRKSRTRPAGWFGCKFA